MLWQTTHLCFCLHPDSGPSVGLLQFSHNTLALSYIGWKYKVWEDTRVSRGTENTASAVAWEQQGNSASVIWPIQFQLELGT